MPRDLTHQEKTLWANTFREKLNTWEWINGSFKPEAPLYFLRQTPTGAYFLGESGVPAKMNCWEAVLISGIVAGIYTKDGVIEALKMKQDTPNNRLMWYMYTNPDLVVARGAAIPSGIGLGSLLMFGRNGDHFAYSLGGDALLNLDKSQKGEKTITWLRNNGYAGETFWPLFVKKPPDLPADVK